MTTDLTNLVGQSLMLQFGGSDLTPEVRAALRAIRPGGVVLFSSNIDSPAQVAGLCGALQAEARGLGLPPLVIAVDQEGGTVSRLPAPFVTVPSPMAQAATGDPGAAERCALISGRQLRAVGITMNFAPVLDINNQPANPVIRTRSFGDDPAAVTRFGVAAVRGYEAANIIATVKHFPGHGDTAVDSHHGLPTVAHGLDRLRAVELAPFAAAIAAGVPAVMTAHIVFSALDDVPATLSRRILTGLLREEMGFTGLIVTDAMDMGAIVARYGQANAVVAAKAAGADLLEMVDTLDTQIAAATALRAAAESGRLPLACFEDTAARLTALRTRYTITGETSPATAVDPALAAEALSIARQGITVLHGAETLPIPADARLVVIDCQRRRSSLAEDPVDRAGILRHAITAAFPRAVTRTIGEDASPDDVSAARALAATGDRVLLVTRDANLAPLHTRLGQDLVAGPCPLIHASVRAPYDAHSLPGAATTLLTFGDPPVSLQALADVLVGKAVAEGISPVALLTV